MSDDLSIAVALFAGVVSFLSPCVLPLVPAYLGQLTTIAVAAQADGSRRPVGWRCVTQGPSSWGSEPSSRSSA